jgi:hypothetical protein
MRLREERLRFGGNVLLENVFDGVHYGVCLPRLLALVCYCDA